jgi:hypothetical protein
VSHLYKMYACYSPRDATDPVIFFRQALSSAATGDAGFRAGIFVSDRVYLAGIYTPGEPSPSFTAVPLSHVSVRKGQDGKDI